MPENRILLIEDEAATRELLSHVLMAAGYAVDVAETASIAGARLASTTYALVLADWRLPDGDGIELADRAAEAGASTAIMSGYLFPAP
jgi:two-component system OmpR family response regulator